MAITPPPELKYGYVVGKIVRTIADDIDADFFPDTVPASGQVTFKPVKSTSNTTNYPAIVMHESVTGVIQESTGELYSTTGDKGVWLVVGVYDVVFNLNFGTLTGFQITVTEAHTKAKPLDLALYRPVPTDPSTKFVVNEQIYINTLAEADRATAEANKSATEAAKSKTEATRAKTEADRAASQVDTKLSSLKASGELTGPAGPSNVLSIGTVSATTGNPSATISGTSPSQTLNLTLKTGATGAKGDKGDTGAQGPKGDKGDKGDQGIQGIKGDTGATGPANVLSVGTVTATTGNPSATITGTSPNQTLNLTLKTGATGPKGDKGATGDQGPKGDKGDQGTGLNVLGSFSSSSQLPTTGNPGDAYLIGGDLWVWSESTNKYVNTGSVKGDKGDQGDPGLDSVLPLREIPSTSSPATDMNTLTETGIYPFTSATYVTNFPSGGHGAGVLVVTPFSFTNLTYRIQEVTYYTSRRRYIRATNAGATGWNDWREMAGTEVATSSSDGLMAKADKSLLDAATASNTGSTIVKRWSSGSITVPGTPTSDNEATSKFYVDGQIAKQVGFSFVALTSQNLNDVTATGWYRCGTSSNATTEKNYPAEGAVAGWLQVYTETNMTWQVYTPYKDYSNNMFIRGSYNGEWSTWSRYTSNKATSSSDGLMSKEDKTILDGAATTTTGGALVKRESTGNIAVPATPGSTNSATSKSYVDSSIASATPKIPVATPTVDGLMAKSDKSKLDGIEAGAKATITSADISDATTHAKALLTSTSTTAARSAIGAQSTLSSGSTALLTTGTSTSNYIWSPKAIADYVKAATPTIPTATTSVDGLMAKADKSKLDGIEAGAKATFKSADITDASTHAKSLLKSTSTATARSAIGADQSRSTGTTALLNTGTSTTAYVWNPKSIADYVKDQVNPPKTFATGITAREGTYNSTTGIYTPKNRFNPPLKPTIMGNLAGSQLDLGLSSATFSTQLKVLYTGDSEVTGTGAVPGTSDATTQAVGMFSSAGHTVSDGLVACYDNNKNNGITNSDARITTTGTWAVAGIKTSPEKPDYQYHIASGSSGATITFKFNNPSTNINVVTFGNSGTATYSVDGGTAKDFAFNGNSEFQIVNINGLANEKHTIKITATSKKKVYIFGAEAFSGNTLEISKLGFWGATAWAGLPRTWWSYTEWVKLYQPDAIVLQYGTNEALHRGFTTDQYKGFMGKIISHLRKITHNVPIYLMSSFQPNVSDSVWTTWRNAQYDVADENGILLGDIVGKIGSKSANSSLYADATHPNSAGYTKQAEVLKDLLQS